MSKRDQLVSMFTAGVDAVAGRKSVINALAAEADFKPSMIIAVGKAASEMCLGAQSRYGDNIPALVVTKYGHTDASLLANSNVELIEAGHPIPDECSLFAGSRLSETISSLSTECHLLMLVSGGASALAEHLPDHLSLDSWRAKTKHMVSSGLSIEQINIERKAISRIKDGRLLAQFQGESVMTCAISDVEGDDISTIGSGIGDVKGTQAKAQIKLIASNKFARNAVAAQASELGYDIKENSETLYDDVFVLSRKIGTYLRGASAGVYIWGGEPTINLPDNPGEGGRNQALALALAKEISGTNHINILVGGTDGTDGPTEAAGAVVNGASFHYSLGAQQALDDANSGAYLRSAGDILVTGPTGTNVMDLLIAVVDK